MLLKSIAGLSLVAITFAASVQPVLASDATCYNCPPEWANWGGQLKQIKKELNISVPMDNKNSGQTLSQLIAEKNSPVADVAYYGVSFGIKAAEQDVVTGYKPKNWDQIPAGLKDPDGKWFAIHSGTLGFFVNKDALEGKPVPESWADLLKSDYRGMVGYLDPTSAFVGYAGAVAVNRAMGGDLSNFDPAIEYFAKLKKNKPIVPKQTSYARVLSGEIPILLDFDFNAYRAKYKDHANIEFVIPKEGSLVVPYVMSQVKNSPNPDNAKKILDFVLSDKGQKVWAQAFLRPVVASAMDEETKKKFLPASDYARATAIDFASMAGAQTGFAQRYLKEVK
ncbi:putative ABC Spermidine/putrescine transporter periplasmic protein [Vibrio nigripulchritudo SO65]|uniref:ABC transporter substrate-binding protein n=1 Tax=Vibrio nigripulchritudo TaxID=28173 RepID=UPI0003B1C4D5|nr:ABC transporter substrate-binding protein [Vibrio nigripulchritudo]KJY78293.1 ABC transporter substrate-binding protein [Vibrio nigripulchritudo]CCN37019.1 putative ABC Spermidine/putrescine transporter periplasmic protein [Vibrio nigripulchritudo AM115]CCN41761.1 putative ABC Spermidine/putrescine transporter periplasmic protein [Vibrio nigripulchritudo FTn2]CCN66446.1 putative ABC Spermidine/putrescine transporter periplasmic protein [Vibrio nigripulchritudo POn4]CCN74540.1 putative ABC S